MSDALDLAKTRTERLARNMIYPGGKLHMSFYEDKDVGNIYIAVGKGDFACDQFGREAPIDAKSEDCVLIKDVWRGVWMGMLGKQGMGEKINCIAGDWTLEQVFNDAVKHAQDTLKRMKKGGAMEEGFWNG